MIAPVRWHVILVIFLAVSVAYEERIWHPPKDTRSPQDVMVDVVNDLGLNVLKIHNSNNENNIAISPYGIVSILTALLEGTRGRAALEIQKCGGFPADRDVIRVGLRDIHRLLRSYFIPQEGFLSGLSLSSEKVTLKPEYQSVLRFYGYDMDSFNTPIYPSVETTTPINNITTMSDEDITTETTIQTTEETITVPTTIPTTTTMTIPTTTTIKEDTTTMKEETTTMKQETTTTMMPETTTIPTTTERVTTTETTTMGETTITIPTTEQMDRNMPTETTLGPTTTTLPETTTETPMTRTTRSVDTTFTTTTADTTETTLTTQVIDIENIIETTITTQPRTTNNANTTNTADTRETTITTQAIPTLIDIENITETTMTTQVRTTRSADTTNTADTTETTMTTLFGTTRTADTTLTATNTAGTAETTFTTQEITSTDTFSTETTTVGAETSTFRMRIGRSVTDYLIAQYYDDQASPIYNEPLNKQHAFLVNSKYQESHVHFMTYDAVLPFYYVHNLNALALRFPLDSPRYYLLLVLPVDEEGIDKLICDIGNSVTLKQIVSHLRPTYVRAVIPSFMLRGFVILTSSLQKIGIRQIFEPRHTDFSPMTDDKDIYVTNIEQAITVLIKNYMDPTMINKNRNLYQYGPVEFKATHPFLYFVMDSEIDVTLVAGKIVNPINSRIQ